MLAKVDENTWKMLEQSQPQSQFVASMKWLALKTRSNKEQAAADWLRKDRFRVYWPNYIAVEGSGKLPNGRQGRAPVLRAIIPGYLFFGVRDEQEFDVTAICENTPGIMGYMRDPRGGYATLGHPDIAKIRIIEAGQNLPPSKESVHRFHIGQRVRFTDDLIDRWPPGKIIALAKNGRITTGVRLLGQIVPITGLPHQIEAI